jgi:hypothetical protein
MGFVGYAALLQSAGNGEMAEDPELRSGLVCHDPVGVSADGGWNGVWGGLVSVGDA